MYNVLCIPGQLVLSTDQWFCMQDVWDFRKHFRKPVFLVFTIGMLNKTSRFLKMFIPCIQIHIVCHMCPLGCMEHLCIIYYIPAQITGHSGEYCTHFQNSSLSGITAIETVPELFKVHYSAYTCSGIHGDKVL